MLSRISVCLAFLCAPILFAARVDQPGDSLVAHEWGTFTSVAGENGAPVSWLPLSGPSDLPCFVYRLVGRSIKLSLGLVRMETPVVYFYAPRAVTLSVRVGFPEGLITEWYPQATKVLPELAYPQSGLVNSNGEIEWNSVEVKPAERLELPVEKAASHYYAARQTDSAPIRVGQQQEKLLFYRGLGNFSVPLRARIADDARLEIRNTGSDPIAAAILFENRGGKAGYRVIRELKDAMTLELPDLTADVGRLRRELEEILVTQGLYPKEAHAMVETWRDSWFEEGTRVFYAVPRATVDSILPLTIAPAPREVARVFVGRVEVLSPWMEKNIQTALAAGDVRTLEKYGRFLQPFRSQIQRTKGRLYQSGGAAIFLQSAYAEVQREFDSQACILPSPR
jgi:hypothetical protein